MVLVDSDVTNDFRGNILHLLTNKTSSSAYNFIHIQGDEGNDIFTVTGSGVLSLSNSNPYNSRRPLSAT